MSEFKTDLYVHLIESRMPRSIWALTADFVYESELLGQDVIVPIGFRTDFASVPRLPVAWLYAGGCAPKSAVVHDYLVRTAEVPREQADEVFLEAMGAEGIEENRRQIMYRAVCLATWANQFGE